MPQSEKAQAIAQNLYRRAYRRGNLEKMRAMLTRCQRHLFELATVQTSYNLRNLHDSRSQMVPINRIRGTVSRARDFDIEFYPLQAHDQERWQRVAAAYIASKNLPPIMVIQIADTYFVQDGHHRVSIARLLNQTNINAVVARWQLDEPLSPGSPGSSGLATCLHDCLYDKKCGQSIG